jgi:hypothetical protein
MRGRPDLRAALEAVHTNPGAALAPVPLPRLPTLLEVRRWTARRSARLQT